MRVRQKKQSITKNRSSLGSTKRKETNSFFDKTLETITKPNNIKPVFVSQIKGRPTSDVDFKPSVEEQIGQAESTTVTSQFCCFQGTAQVTMNAIQHQLIQIQAKTTRWRWCQGCSLKGPLNYWLLIGRKVDQQKNTSIKRWKKRFGSSCYLAHHHIAFWGWR